MSFFDDVVESFASPVGIARNPGVVSHVMAAFAQVVAKRVLATSEDIMTSPSVREAVRKSTDAMRPDQAWWVPELSNPLGNIVRGRPINAILSYLIATHINGFAHDWSLVLEEPVRLSLAGNVFTLSGYVSATTDGERIAFVMNDELRLAFLRDGNKWRCENSPVSYRFELKEPTYLDDARFGSLYVLSTNLPAGGDNDGIDWPPPTELQDLTSQAMALPLLRKAMDSLSAADPAFHWWIGDLLRGVATMPLLANGHRHSGSSIHFAGVVSSGFPADEEAVAESLVHEVSHQYFLLLESIVPMVDPAQEGIQVWSTFKGRNRPLNRVLLAYHAAANMALYWAGVAASRGRTDYRLHELRDALSHVERMGADIRSTDALSAHGRSFFERLESLVHNRCFDTSLVDG